MLQLKYSKTFLSTLFPRSSEERVGVKSSKSPEVRRVKSSEKIKTEDEPVVKVKTEGNLVKSSETKSVFSRLGATEQVKHGVGRYQ